jgi:DNA topoisomerase IA
LNHQAKTKNYLVPTETGKLVVDSPTGKFKLMNLEFTRDVEEDPDRIAQAKRNAICAGRDIFSMATRSVLRASPNMWEEVYTPSHSGLQK